MVPICESGVNVEQLRLSIVQIEEMLGLQQEWLEQLHHLAGHADIGDADVELAQVTVMLGEARAKLENAAETLEEHGDGDGVTVERVG